MLEILCTTGEIQISIKIYVGVFSKESKRAYLIYRSLVLSAKLKKKI